MRSNTLSKTYKLKLTLLFITSILTCVYFRLYAHYEYPKAMARNSANLFVYSNIKKVVDEKSSEKFSEYPIERQKTLRDHLFKQTVKSENLKIKLMVEDGIKRILPQFQESINYLAEVDPYYYLHLTKQVLQKGSFADQRNGRNYLNPMMLAPLGAWYPIDYHPYVGAFLYKFLSVFRPSISLAQALSWVPVALSCLCLIPLFLILFWRFQLSWAASIASIAFFVSCPMFVRRSLYGWFDTDPYNLLFPLILLYFFLGVLSFNNFSGRKILLNGLGLGITFGLYSLFWRGWALIFFTYTLLAMLTSLLLSHENKITFWKTLGITFLVMILVLLTFWGPVGLKQTLEDAYSFASDFANPVFSVWPDIFISVGELKPLTFLKLATLVTYPFVFLFSIFGLIQGVWKRFIQKESTLAPYMLISFLSILYFYLSLQVERFALFLVVPLSLALALSFNEILQWLRRLIELLPYSNITKETVCRAIASLGLIGFIYSIFNFSQESIRVEHPIYNKSWDKMMRLIREETPSDSIVTAWWSPGHFITGMGERRVTFDGATQNTPQAYWVARFFLENSEEKAYGILRMLNTSGNEALNYLESQKILLPDAIGLLDSIFALNREEAAKVLSKSLRPEQIEKVLNFTHPIQASAPGYVFLYDDMIRQIMALEFIGNWDFEKAFRFKEYLKENQNKLPPGTLKRGHPANTRLLWSLSKGPWPEDQEALLSQETPNAWIFNNGVMLQKNLNQVSIRSQKFGKGIPTELWILNSDGSVQKKLQKEANLNLCVLFLKDELKTVIADKRLINSLAFRLYYLNGLGLKHFKLVGSERNDLTQNRFFLYKIKESTL